MNHKPLYSLLFVFLTALTVNMAHVVTEHERDVCEICLHIQANDEFDVLTDIDLTAVELPDYTSFKAPAFVHTSKTFSLTSIRAPPFFA